MNALLSLSDRISDRMADLAPVILPTLARLIFAGVLLVYFWSSGLTKLGEGLFGFLSPSAGAYIQIFPREAEAVGYDVSQFGTFHWAVVTAGTLAEFILPFLIVIGLLTRLASLGMIGFIAVQSLTDIVGHGVGGDDLGDWFDAASGALIADQRALWVLLLAVPLFLGPGPVSVGAALRTRKLQTA